MSRDGKILSVSTVTMRFPSSFLSIEFCNAAIVASRSLPDSDSSEDSEEVVRAPSRGPSNHRLSDSEDDDDDDDEYPDQKHRRHPPQRIATAGGKQRRVGAAAASVQV